VGFVVAIDGPAASGKGTIAVRLGKAFGLPVLDTGLLYRAVAAAVIAARADPTHEEVCAHFARDLDLARLSDPSLRAEAVGETASRVAAHPKVREALIEVQRAFAARPPGAVLDGRDIGTVIVPTAPAKLYITASAKTRAERRWRELTRRGEAVALADILADIERRDTRDGERAAAPLRPAADAVLLDTTDLTIDDAFDAARRIVEAARARSGLG
jgi:CMP/dCMP kinase